MNGGLQANFLSTHSAKQSTQLHFIRKLLHWSVRLFCTLHNLLILNQLFQNYFSFFELPIFFFLFRFLKPNLILTSSAVPLWMFTHLKKFSG